MDDIQVVVDDSQETVSLFVTQSVSSVDSVNSQTGVVVLDADDISDSSTTNKYTNASDISKLSGIEAGAEVNTVDSVNGQTGVVVLAEDDVKGVRITANVATTYAIDWNAGSVFELTMTADTTFSDSNLPTTTKTQVIEVVLNGNFAATLPAYWEALPSNDSYLGTVRNHIVVSCIVGTTSSEDVLYSLENLSA
jgi:hypothetical protein